MKTNTNKINSLVIAIVIFCLFLSAEYQNKLNHDQFDELHNMMAEMRDNHKIDMQNASKLIAINRNDANHPLCLTSVQNIPYICNNAMVYYNRLDKKSYFEQLCLLPAQPADQKYRLWAIANDVPVDMGVIDFPQMRFRVIDVPYIENAQSFLISLENAAGSEVPKEEDIWLRVDL